MISVRSWSWSIESILATSIFNHQNQLKANIVTEMNAKKEEKKKNYNRKRKKKFL